METRTRSSGIPKIDEELKAILQMPKRDLEKTPKCVPLLGKDGRPPKIHIVGAGSHVGSILTALVGAGCEVIAHEKNPDKIGKGRRGLMEKYFEIAPAASLRWMPDFTPDEQAQMPPFISAIANDPNYKLLRQKSQFADDMLNNTPRGIDAVEQLKAEYNALPSSQKISMKEFTDMNDVIIRILKNAGVLTIVLEEVTIEMVNAWVETNQGVFLATGTSEAMLANLDDHVRDTDGFVEKFVRDDKKTEALLKRFSDQQNDPHNRGEPLTVAFVDDGVDALKGVQSLLESVSPGHLRIVWIGPEYNYESSDRVGKTLAERRACMDYQTIYGFVSKMTISENGAKMLSLKVTDYFQSSVSDVRPDLVVHSCDELMSREACSLRDSMTKLITGETPVNAIVRWRNIVPVDSPEIETRIIEPWTVSLDDDSELKTKIQDVIEKSKRESTTILLNGNNAMCDRVVVLAASLGYNGRLLHIKPNKNLGDLYELQTKTTELECHWDIIPGIPMNDGIRYENGEYELKIRRPDKKYEHLRNINFIIRSEGNRKTTPLLEGMKQRGYISKNWDRHVDSFYSNHPTVFGHYTVVRDKQDDFDVDSPRFCFTPVYEGKSRDPHRWDNSFNWARSLSALSKL